jgi:phosphatidylethanolamine-binding protein (PEBP) family uncharacterized protein
MSRRKLHVIASSRGRRLSLPVAVSACLIALAPAGCGSRSDPGSSELRTVLASPALTAGHRIRARYTCDGGDVSLQLVWSRLPAGTREVDLFVLGVASARRVSSAKTHDTLTVQWAVAGLSPALHAIAAGHLPAGAIVGRGTGGRARYSMCPAKGRLTKYFVLLYALPRRLALRPGFQGSAALVNAGRIALEPGLLKATAVLTASYRRA